jgi:precorrin-8X/cobalt-precorrin-8 methylmutase
MRAAAIPRQSDDYGIVLVGHGSQDASGVREFVELVQIMKERANGRRIDHGFLEFVSPTIKDAVAASVAAGSHKVVVIPALLAAAAHAKNDMPVQLTTLKEQYPQIDLLFGAVMDLHPTLLQLCQQRIIEAEAKSRQRIKRSETCLVVVGRGTSDPDANSEIAKLTRILQEGMGFAASLVCYSGTAKPLVGEGLRLAARLGNKRITVLPYLLFDGILVKRILKAADALSKRHPEMEILTTGYLGVHADIADVFLEKAKESIEGRALMNCSLCKYRTPIVGFESQLGAPQVMPAEALSSMQSQENTPTIKKSKCQAYVPHAIEAESFRVIEGVRDWSEFAGATKQVIQRLVHTTGDPDIVEDLYFSKGAVEAGIRALLRCRAVVTDVTMVKSGIKRSLIEQLGLTVWCGVHDRETELIACATQKTRSATAMMRAQEIFGNDVILAIGDAPTALMEALVLIRHGGWRPQLIVGLPVGFVGTAASKEELRKCLHIPRITNRGNRGGSPWAASVINALAICAVNELAGLTG